MKLPSIYNGLGQRIEKQTGRVGGSIPQVATDQTLDPMERLHQQNFLPTEKIDYTLDRTRKYHNLLQRHEVGADQNRT